MKIPERSEATPTSVVRHPEGTFPTEIVSTVLVPVANRLVGLVVKASASRMEDPGFESRLHRDFYAVEYIVT